MSEQNKKNVNSRVQRIVAIVLTAAFIPMVFGFGIYGLTSDFAEVVDSLRYHHARTYLANEEEENTKFFPMLKARIQSLQTALGEMIPFADELGWLNASVQYAIGKNMVVQGPQQLLTLPGGQIYNMTERESLEWEAREVVDFYNQVNGEIPFLFTYIHPQFFADSPAMPAGYDVLDTGDELADEVLGIVREAGIPTMDSRDFFADCGFSDDELNYRTDMHWTTLAGLLAAQIYAKEINALTGAELDLSRLDLENFETFVYEDFFLGEYGQQIGAMNSGYDDIIGYLPTYETNLTRYTIDRFGEEEQVSGKFADSMVKWNYLEPEADGHALYAYAAFGLVETLEQITNHGDCADMTILFFRDSYTAPVGTFLSLLVKNMVMVDMRYNDESAIELVQKYDPDIILFSHSRQMYEKHSYTLGVE